MRAAVAFEHQQGQLLGVRVEVMNETNAPFDVQPSDFSYVVCSGAGVATCGAAQRIVDPETVLAVLDESESQVNAAEENREAFLGGMMLLSVVSDVGSVATHHPNRNAGLRNASIGHQVEEVSLQHEVVGASISAQRDHWSNVVLRRNTLLPGAGISGLVYVPIQQGAARVWLTVRADGRQFPFCFSQTVTPVSDGSRPDVHPSPASRGGATY